MSADTGSPGAGPSPEVPADEASWRQLLRPANLAPLSVVCLGVWLHAADGLMVATLIPAIVGEIGGAGLVAWTIALYEIGSIVAGAASALVGLRLGLRRAMMAAALLYAAGCAVSALSPTMAVMLAGRLMQGLGGGGMMALAFVSVSSLFGRALMPRVLASISALWGVSAFLGPLIGGVFAEIDWWQGAFWAFAAQAIVLALWVGVALPSGGRRAPEGREAGRRLPVMRLLVLSASVVAIAAAGIEVSAWGSPLLVAAGLGLLVLFLLADTAAAGDRLLPRGPADPRHEVGAALVTIFCFATATIALMVYGPLLMTALFGVRPLVAGYVLAASSVAWTVAALIVAGAGERHDRRFVFAGMTLVTLGVAGMVPAMAYGPVWLIAVCGAMDGAGFGMAWTFILRRATAFTAGAERDRLATAMPTTQRFGYAVGAALAGIVANAFGMADQMTPAAARPVAIAVFASFVPLTLAGLAATWMFVRRPLPDTGT